MDSFQLNKMAGAFLGTVFILFSVGLISDVLFDSPAPEKPGYVIEAAEAADAGAAPAGEPAKVEPIAPLLAAADAKVGETIFKKCQACHTGDKGGANKVGPNLYGIVGRPVASHEGFGYSAAIKDFSKGGAAVWDYESIASFITAPKAYIKGTAMGFAGLKKPEERANLIAYLRTLSDSPVALP